MTGTLPRLHIANLILTFFGRIRAWIVNRPRTDNGQECVSFLLTLTTILGAVFLWGYENYDANRPSGLLFGSNMKESFAAVFGGGFYAIFACFLIRESYATTMARLREIFEGYYVGGNARSEFIWYTVFTVILVIHAYLLDGRINNFAQSFTSGHLALAYVVPTLLWLPPVAMAFIAITAFQVRTYPKRDWQK